MFDDVFKAAKAVQAISQAWLHRVLETLTTTALTESWPFADKLSRV